MINSQQLLTALQKQVTRLENDFRARCNADPLVDAPLKADYDKAKAGGRVASTYSAWRDEEITQAAVAWVLACVFVRFLEDNDLIDTPYLAGPGPRLQRAKDEHELFFRQFPTLTEREYLQQVFGIVGKLPAMKEFFDRKHNPLWRVGPTGDAARNLLDFWCKTDPDTGLLIHDFTDPDWNTRFLGDLYQELSEAAKKKFALLQTPDFVEEFILDRTLTPAIQTFGYQVVRMIDPTCGSGHFCLGGFHRLFRLWQEHQPGENPRVLAQKALDGVYGVDLNPYAVAIARFRLLLAALRACCVRKLKNAPDFKINLAVGDSLLHGRRFSDFADNTGPQRTFDTEEIFRDELKHHYDVEDLDELHRILGQQYHAVVGNPPYITVKDKALSEQYRARYQSCSGKYSLSVPFMERFFDLAIKGDGTPQQQAGFVGQITANSFMKREFGKKLIEEYLPHWDLTHVIDTSGAYIPGHGTPTVIIFGNNKPPVGSSIRTVFGIKGEPSTPSDSTQGHVWRAICQQVDHPGSVSEWVSAADSLRNNFRKHPWSIGGGGASELKEQIDASVETTIEAFVDNIGICAVTLEDDAFTAPSGTFVRHNINRSLSVPFIEGDAIRHWQTTPENEALFPYEPKALVPTSTENLLSFLWPLRSTLRNRSWFRKTQDERGLHWYEYGFLSKEQFRASGSIAFAFVATHNNFALQDKLSVFNRSSPTIRLCDSAFTSLQLIGALNCSLGCFWMKQIFFPKGGDQVGKEGARIRKTLWDERYEHDTAKLTAFPIPSYLPTTLPAALVQISKTLHTQSSATMLANWRGPESGELRQQLASTRIAYMEHHQEMIAWQEELDWQLYEAFGLIESSDQVSLPEDKAVDAIPPNGIVLGQRAFEIVLARRMAAGEVQTTWFERHGSTPITELPAHWPTEYRKLVEHRIERITSDANIRLIEQPEYKRRWNAEPWDEQLKRALCRWLLNRLEGYFYEGNRVCEIKDGFNPAARGFSAASGPHLISTNQLAETVQSDKAFLQVAEIYTGAPGFSVPKLIRELVEAESVPNLPAHRYKDSGLRHRRDWEQVWELQRKEDAIEEQVRSEWIKKHGPITAVGEEQLKPLIRKAQLEKVGEVPVPPKYSSKDFKKSTYWKLRGKLDVPKERWIIYCGAERDGDASPMIAWAGWNHLQQAQALAEYYLDAKQNQGWPPNKLKVLLAGLLNLLPWLKQWHNQVDPDYGMGLGDYFAGFLEEQYRSLSVVPGEIDLVRFESHSAHNNLNHDAEHEVI